MNFIENYKTVLDRIRGDEYDETCQLLDKYFAANLLAAQDPIINTLYQPFHLNCLKVEEIMKLIPASPFTPLMKHADRERSIEVNSACRTVEINLNDEFEPARKAAAILLHPIVSAYRGATHRTLTGETSYIRNFLVDMQAPENTAAVNILDLTAKLVRLGSLNLQFENFLLDREHKWQSLHLGSLKPVRHDASYTFGNLAACINLHYLASVLNGAPSAALRKIIDDVNDIFRPFRRSLAHRGVHLTADNDNDYQTPDVNLPAAPNTPDQNPANTPPAINPDDLNPPAAGEH